jgi:hypothetical protein
VLLGYAKKVNFTTDDQMRSWCKTGRMGARSVKNPARLSNERITEIFEEEHRFHNGLLCNWSKTFMQVIYDSLH